MVPKMKRSVRIQQKNTTDFTEEATEIHREVSVLVRGRFREIRGIPLLFARKPNAKPECVKASRIA
jgi:hypothetical protein